jgi:hypothetical protein
MIIIGKLLLRLVKTNKVLIPPITLSTLINGWFWNLIILSGKVGVSQPCFIPIQILCKILFF